MIISENKSLGEGQKQRVLKRIRERNFTCVSCGSRDFEIGAALEVGFLFLTEQPGTYMVALTCKKPDCASPRTGIKLHKSEFLHES